MNITFAKAPLVELIVELRWIPQGISPPDPKELQLGAATFPFGGGKQEEFYGRFGSAIYKHGFDRSERLLPPGLALLHQPVFRFRTEKDEGKSVLYQTGFGVCSIHAVPPYHSWSKFLPFVQIGVETLFASRMEAESKAPLTQVALRYIDFFGEELTQGRGAPSFLNEVFGISCTIPKSLSDVSLSKEPKNLSTKIVMQIEAGELSLSVGDGKFNNQSGILLDTQASSLSETPATLDAIMKVLSDEYGVIHKMFLELTKPIHELMQPQGATTK